MIQYIPNKKISYDRVRSLMDVSAKINHFTNSGPVKAMLERSLEELLDIEPTKRVICFSSATSALHALMFMYSSRGVHKWITPTFTFPSVVVGGMFDVAIADIDPDTCTLPLNDHILDGSDGVVITNLFGCDVGVEAWAEHCKQHKKVLIFDNASSPMTVVGGRNICNFGDASIVSLHHTKYLGFGEGGCAIIDADDYQMMTAISNFGFLDSREYKIQSSNFKMSDIAAAFILQHIEQYRMDKHMVRQASIVKQLHGTAKPLLWKPGTVYGNLPIVFDRNIDHTYFQAHRIVTQKYYKPLAPFTNSVALYEKIVNFPLSAYLTPANVKSIVTAIQTHETI